MGFYEREIPYGNKCKSCPYLIIQGKEKFCTVFGKVKSYKKCDINTNLIKAGVVEKA